MAEGDTRSSSSLLSKVARFVRNPTKDWSELDAPDLPQDSGYSREALKEMIERKRQNDFVRKREFDHLRKLRRREPMMPGDPAGRPSFFQSSLTSNHDDRAETLKKIDEIEAQMSRQWWKGKQGEEAAGQTAGFPHSAPMKPVAGTPQSPVPKMIDRLADAAPMERDSAFAPTEPSPLRLGTSKWGGASPGPTPGQVVQFAPTVPAVLPSTVPAAVALPPQSERGTMGAGFTTQRLYGVAADSLADPDLEEAAIRFANQDDAGAEESLLGALQAPNIRPEMAEVWLAALFDLYRATGQQARFDSMAIESANRFGHSAPAWFSMPEMLKRSRANLGVERARPAPSAAAEPDWRCPARLTAAALEELAVLTRMPDTVLLDWGALTEIGLDAVAPLARQVAHWAQMPSRLVFRRHAVLERALQALTPSGDRTVAPMCWKLRMDALRIMHRQDEFELVALDYCVTYEVSPPSWQDPRCTCELQDLNDPQAQEEEDLRSNWDLPHSKWDDPLAHLSTPAGLDEQPPAVVDLYGEIVGDANEVMAKLQKGMAGNNRMVVSCARLIRIDFTAAGGVLNWAAEQQGKGCQIQFRDVNRMVAAFFNVVGINEYARVVPRRG